MRKSSRLVFVLSTGVTAVIVWLLLLYPEFLADKRTPVKGLLVFRKERTPNVRKQPTKVMSPDEYLLRRGFSIQEVKNMSPLGRWLLAPEGNAPLRSNAANRSYLILVWKHGPFLERRHIRRFTSNKFSPWEQCTVKNCVLSYDEKDLHLADAAVFHLHLTKSPSELPARNRTDQRWIFLTDESPYHTFLHGNQKLSDYDGLFNWSMSYRMDSDVPVPYGRTIKIAADDAASNNGTERWDIAVRTSKTKLVAVMGSNCGSRNGRWVYIKALKSLLHDQLDIFGSCLNGNRTACPGHFARDCAALTRYKFYLSFENSNCREYMTEKVFWNAYGKLAVPIIMGAPVRDCWRYLPPHSFLHVDDFASVNALADYLRYLDRDDERYLKYHEWRGRYKVINEHGYFGSASRSYCRICEALNYNPFETKVYENLERFWSKTRDCSSK